MASSRLSGIERPRLALTLGDPAGIGPEIILKALADPALSQVAEITVVGDPAVLTQTYQALKTTSAELLQDPASISYLACPSAGAITVGQGNPQSGESSFLWLETAITATLQHRFDGIVTAPIAKFAWAAAGRHFPGQTEVLAQMAQAALSPTAARIPYGMLFVARSPYSGWDLRVLLATTHISLRQVPDALTPERVQEKLDLLVKTLRQDFGIPHPHIVVAGLNPHSGEQGQLGSEEQDWLIPLLEHYQQEHQGTLSLRGPIPPDTLWMSPAQAWQDPKAVNKGSDGYLALYHDQGLIPVKMLAFDQAVNTTIGLPFIRTSPDHGTAFDIVGQGIARSDSLKAAIRLAAELCLSKTHVRQKV